MSAMDFILKFFKHETEFSSMPVEAWNSLHEKYSMSDYIPYGSFDSVDQLYHHKDGSIGFVMEVAPRTRCGGATAVAMSEILSKMPENVFLQVTYYGSKNIEPMLDAFVKEHRKRGQLGDSNSDAAIDMFAEFLRSKTKESITNTMVTKLKTIRLFFSVVGNEKAKKRDIKRFKENLRNILHSNNFYPNFLDQSELHNLAYEILNPDISTKNYPDYSSTQELSKQVISANNSYLVDDDYFQTGSTAWVNMTHQSISDRFHIWEFSQKLGDYLGESLNTNQFNDSFIISTTVTKKPPKATSKVNNNHSIIATQNWGNIFRKHAAVRKESLEILDRTQEKREELFEFDMDVLISGKDNKEAELNAQVIESFWNKSGDGRTKIKLEKTKGIHHLAFLNALPMGMSSDYFYFIGGKYRTLFANQAAHIFPLEADTKGGGFNLPVITRRGLLAFIDLFKSSTNFNGFIIATSGAGKSVLLNMIGYLSWARGDRVFVIDYDNSFTGLTETVNGFYLELNPDVKVISFNPFSEIKTEQELREELPYLSTFIYLLGSSKLVTRADEDEKLIKTELQQLMLSQYQIFKDKMEITHIRDAINKEHGDDSRFRDFARQLGQYCRDGMYAGWFSGKCEFTMQTDMMGVEFKGVENHEDLREPLVMLILYHIGKVMYSSDPNKPRIQIILDEAHRFIGKNVVMDDFIDQAYRRARKFNASMIIATQSFTDIASESGGLSKIGASITANAAWKLFLKQTPTSVEAMIKADVFGFDETDKRKLRSVSTRKGEFSEIFVISPDNEMEVVRLVMPKPFYYMTTTDQADKQKIANTMEIHKITKTEAIKRIAEGTA